MSFVDDFFVVILFGIWDHGLLARLPACWADFTMGVSELKSFNKSQVLIGVSSDWEIIDRLMSDNTLTIDNIGCSE